MACFEAWEMQIRLPYRSFRGASSKPGDYFPIEEASNYSRISSEKSYISLNRQCICF
jgi:hypothetical protein